MNIPWEEVLDLNDASDSDSSVRPFKRHHATTTNHSLSQPFLRRCSQTTKTDPPPPPPTPPPSAFSKIPGPAGIVQAAMHRRKNQINENRLMEDFLEEEPIPTQEYIRRAVEDSGSVEDDDFTRDPWLSTVDFLRREGMVLNGDGAIGVPLSVINRWASFDKVDQVVAIVKTCTPNGLGDMKVTLKDPTGTIDAYVHHRVFTEGEFGKYVSVGAVMILQKVAVFSPSRAAHYLNVALSNVVKMPYNVKAQLLTHKLACDDGEEDSRQTLPTHHETVFPKDVSAPLEQNCAALKHVAVDSGDSAKSQVPHNSSSLSPQGRTEGIMNSLRQNACTRADTVIDEQMEQDVQMGNSCHAIGEFRNQNVVSRMDHLFVRQDLACGTKEVAVGTDTGNDKVATIEHLNPNKKIDGGNILEHEQYGGAATDLFGAPNNLENSHDNEIKNRRPSSSRTSLPQWTDEQLEELFAFD